MAGRFRIVEIIGSGGFSVVYRAHQEGMNRFIALKVLKPQASDDDTIVERFRREALFASQLSHPNTITLFDYGQTPDGLCYIAMEYLVGHDLSEEVKYGDPLDPKRVWSILTQVCRSLSEAHKIGLIHRDLKPENIFVVERNDREHIKVLDFGVSKAVSGFRPAGAKSLTPLTLEGTVFGTPLYMAPEQALSEEIGPPADVYALGQIAYEMLTGRAAYIDELTAMDIMLHQINDPPLELPDPLDKTPFADLVRRATIKDPSQRITDAGELLELLQTEEFLPYMDTSALPPALRRQHAAEQARLLAADAEDEGRREIEEVYRWELSVLEEVLASVQESAQMRLVVIRGRPGTGRSNLMRAFLQRHRESSGVRIIHREAFLDGENLDAGLEADLAQGLGLKLRGKGIQEVNRLLGEVLTAPELPTLTELEPVKLDTNPLSLMTSRRDEFMRRLMEPFRRVARVGTLVWAIENLESVDPLTLAFLERFIREVRVHPMPVLLVTTVHPESLLKRSGLTRYGEQLVEAPSTYARHLQLMEPGSRKAGDSEDVSDSMLQRIAQVPEEIDVGGSFAGVIPQTAEMGADEVAGVVEQWAAMADGELEPGPDPRREHQVDTGETQRLEVFTTAENDSVSADPSGMGDVQEAFDTVLGYLAQLDDRVVARKLWEFVHHRVLPFETTRVASVVLEFAERYGIVHLTEESIAFSDLEYADRLRDAFEAREDAQEAHADLARLLLEYAPKPRREDLRRIVYHAVKGGLHKKAIDLLGRAGDEAYGAMDLDLAREYYLQFKGIIDELRTHSPTPPEAFEPYPKIWLRIGEIQGALGEYGAAEDALQRAIRQADEEEPRTAASAHKLLGDLSLAQQRYQEAIEHYRVARDHYHRTSLARAYVGTLGKIGWCLVCMGQSREAEAILLEAIDKAEKLQDQGLLARFHRYVARALGRQARFLESIEHLEMAMELFEAEEDHRDAIHSLDELGTAYFAAGRYVDARESFTRALAYLSSRRLQLEDSPHLGLARALAALGNLDQAELHLVEAMSHYSARDEPIRRAQVQFHLGDLYLAMGRPRLALDHYRHVFQMGERTGHREMAFDAQVRQGYAYFDAGDPDECFQALTDAAAYGEDTGDTNRQFIARAHIIYLQLLLHQFKAQGEMFEALLEEDLSSEGGVRRQVVCDLLQVDVAIAREEYRRAGMMLTRARVGAASLEDYALFIPISRREYRLSTQLGQLGDPHSGAGFALGALVPPEARKRRR